MASRMDGLTLYSCGVPAGVAATLVDRLAEALADGESVLVTGTASPSPLFAAAARHPRLIGTRVFRVGPPLDLIAMLRQVTADDGPADTTLEEGFDALTMPSAGCGRILLLVEEAHLLPHATLRYIEFALRAGPHLQVVLAGQSGIEDMLALEGFAGLRNRIPLHLALPDPVPERPGLPLEKSLPWEPGLVASHRMTPPRLLASAAVAAGLAIAGMMSLAPQVPPAAVASVGSAAPQAAGIDPSPEPASVQAAPITVARPVLEPDTSTAAAQPGPDAAPPPAASDEAGPALAADAPPAPKTVAANAPDSPPAFVPVPTPEAADPPGAAPRQAGTATTVDPPVAPQTAEGDVPGLMMFMPESASEVAEAAAQPERGAAPPPGASNEAGFALAADAPPAALPELQPAAASEPPAAPNQVEAADPGPVPAPAVGTPLTVEPAARPGTAAGMAAPSPPAAQLMVPMPAAKQARTAAPPAAPRAPARSAPIRAERVADRLPALGGDGQRCRGIILRLQLGESPTDGDRIYLRNGCR